MKVELDREKLPDDIDVLKDEYIKLGMELNTKIFYLEEQINLLTDKMFGRKSEKSVKSDAAPNLFGINEFGDKPNDRQEHKIIKVKEHNRKKAGRKPIDPNLPVDKIDTIDLPSNEKECECCHKERPYIGYDSTKRVDIIPDKISVIEERTLKYGPCDCDESKLLEKPEVIQAKASLKIIKGSMLTEGALAYIMTCKFSDGLPFYRLAKKLARYGINLTRQMMCDNAISISKKSSLMLELILEQIRDGISINMDETSIKVVTEEDKSPNSKCYMWVMVGRMADNRRMVYFHYDPSRSGKIPAKLLEGFQGYLQTDAYKSYNAMGSNGEIHHVGCNVHARREFEDADKAAKGKSFYPKIALAFYRKIYVLEREYRDKLKNNLIDENKFQEERKKTTIRIFDKFKKWLLKIQNEVLPQGYMGKAINYTLDEWDKLIRYLDVWYLTPDNNVVENAIRPYVIGRKNWMHAYCPDGAVANATFYTILESAKANNLNEYYYLKYLFIYLPRAKTREDLLKLLPINLKNDQILKALELV
jgi:transposase